MVGRKLSRVCCEGVENCPVNVNYRPDSVRLVAESSPESVRNVKKTARNMAEICPGRVRNYA